MAAVATGDLVRSLSGEESLSSPGVSLVARSLSRPEESLSLRWSCLLQGVSHCEESLSSRGVSRKESLVARSLSSRGVSRREEPRREEGGRHNNQNVREVRGEEEDGCGSSRNGGSCEESLGRGVSLIARSLSRCEESLSSRGVSLVAMELLVARSLSL